MANKAQERLNGRQKAFARAYSKGMSGKAAAIKAGYSKLYAETTASKLTINPKVREYIDYLQLRAEEKAIVSPAFVLSGLKENAQRCMQHTPVCNEEGEEIGEYVWNPSPANKAFELLGKHLGLFDERMHLELSLVGAIASLNDDDDEDKEVGDGGQGGPDNQAESLEG